MESMTVKKISEIIERYRRLDVINNDTPISRDYYHMLIEISGSENVSSIISLLVRALWFFSAGGMLFGLDIDNIEKAELIRLIKLTEEKIEELENYRGGIILWHLIKMGRSYRREFTIISRAITI